MKIAFCGTSSVGKSTLARAVAERLKLPILVDTDLHERTFALLESQGRPVSTKYFPGMTRAEHIDFERHLYHVRCMMEVELGEDFVTDESPIDFLNWFYIICGPHPEIMSADEFRFFKMLWMKQIPSYTAIWHLPVGVLPIKDDNRRFTNTVSLEHWDNAIRGLLHKHTSVLDGILHVMPADCLDLKDRVDRVVSELRVKLGLTKLVLGI